VKFYFSFQLKFILIQKKVPADIESFRFGFASFFISLAFAPFLLTPQKWKLF